MSALQPGTTEPFFVRNATGLVRELSAFHALVFNASFINVGLMLIFMFLYVPSFHPGSSMFLATIAATILAIPMSLVNGLLASAFPRSGGEYVYNSRILSPAVGFATNFNITIWLLFYVGVSCVLFSQHGLAPIFRFIGVRWDAPTFVDAATWIAAPIGAFVVGSIVLIAIIGGLSLSTRKTAQLQSWYFVFGVVGVVAAIVIVMGITKHGYATIFDGYFGKALGSKATLATVMSDAKEKGYASSSNTSLLETLIIFFWPANFLFWGNCSTYFGGEIQYARRSQLIGNVGAVIICGLLVALATITYDNSMGSDTIGAITYLQAIGSGFGFAPTYAELAAAATSSSLIGLLLLIACAYWPIAFAPLIIGACTRNFLAWSMDRVAPEALSRVSPRFHTPIPALIMCGIFGELSIYLYAFLPAFAFAVGIVGAFLTFMTTAVSAIIFPFKRTEIFNRSAVNWKIGGYPTISIVGVLALLGLLCVEISVLSDPYSGISLSPTTDAGSGAGIPFVMFWVNLGIFASGFIIYLAAKLIRRGQAIDISLAFKEIPPE